MQNSTKVALPLPQPAPGSGRTSEAAAPQGVRWTKPTLLVYGDIRQLTMGPSPGTGESGNPVNFRQVV